MRNGTRTRTQKGEKEQATGDEKPAISAILASKHLKVFPRRNDFETAVSPLLIS